MSICAGLFEELEDPRSNKNQIYPFEYMMLVTLCACMAGETSFTGIADYDVSCYFKDNSEDFMATFEHHDKGHGRIESRICRVFEDVGWLNEQHNWPGLKSVIAVTRRTITNNKETQEVQYYISSLKTSPERLLTLIRNHWHVENHPT